MNWAVNIVLDDTIGSCWGQTRAPMKAWPVLWHSSGQSLM